VSVVSVLCVVVRSTLLCPWCLYCVLLFVVHYCVRGIDVFVYSVLLLVGTWLCPWHHCLICARPAVASCILCPVAYCVDHVHGNIHVTLKFDVQCTNHKDSPASNEDFVNAWLQFFASVKPVVSRKQPTKVRQHKPQEGAENTVLNSDDIALDNMKGTHEQFKIVGAKTGQARSKTKATKGRGELTERRVSERSHLARQKETLIDSHFNIVIQPDGQNVTGECGRFHRQENLDKKTNPSGKVTPISKVNKSTTNIKRKRKASEVFEESGNEKLTDNDQDSLTPHYLVASTRVTEHKTSSTNIESEIKAKNSRKRIKVSEELIDDEPQKRKKKKSQRASGSHGNGNEDIKKTKKKKLEPDTKISLDIDDELFDLDFSSKSSRKKSSHLIEAPRSKHKHQSSSESFSETPSSKHKHQSSSESFSETPSSKHKHQSSSESCSETQHSKRKHKSSSDSFSETSRSKHKHTSSSDSFSETSHSKDKHKSSSDSTGGLSNAEVLWSSMLASSNTELRASSRDTKTSTSVIKQSSIASSREAKTSTSTNVKPPVLKSFIEEPLFDDDDDFPQLVIDVPTI